MTSIREAAAARAAGVAQRSHRPSQRRCAEAPGSRAAARGTLTGVQLREAGTSGTLRFAGVASVTETPYEMHDMFGPYTEIVSAGAFAGTLNRADLDVPLVLDHDSLRRIARTTLGTLRLEENEAGLAVDADLDESDPDVAYIAPKLRAGLIDEMSFMFRIIRGAWSPDWETYRIDEVDIHRGDVAIVGFGANPFTAGAGLRAARVDTRRMRLDLALATG